MKSAKQVRRAIKSGKNLMLVRFSDFTEFTGRPIVSLWNTQAQAMQFVQPGEDFVLLDVKAIS